MKVFVQALAAVAFTAISSFVQGENGPPVTPTLFCGTPPSSYSDDHQVFNGMRVTAAWVEGTSKRVNSVGLFYMDQRGVERSIYHGFAETGGDYINLDAGEYINSFACHYDGKVVTYVEIGTTKPINSSISAGTKPPNAPPPETKTDFQIGGFMSNRESRYQITGIGGLWVCRHENC